MIFRAIGRVLWVAIAFFVAAFAGLIVLVFLGAAWVGEALRAAAPHDPIHDGFGAIVGGILFTAAVAPALTALPALIAVVVGEVLRIRSWLYYVLAGGAALAAIPLMAGARAPEVPPVPAAEYMTIFAVAGFAAGFVYWLLAGQRA